MEGQVAGSRQHLGGGTAGFAGGTGDLADAKADFRRAMGRFMDIAGDLTGGGSLLIDCGGDGGSDFVDADNGMADVTDGIDSTTGGSLDRIDLAGDLAGRAGRLVGQ